MENLEFLKLIGSRRSCRAYLNKPVDKKDLQAILEAGMAAPSAMGAQDAFIVAVTKPELTAKLRRMNAQVMGTDTDPYYGAPVIVLVFASRTNKNGVQDGSCILENMMLAAHALGLGSCWINRENEMFDTEEGRELMRGMGLPEGLAGVGAIALGYAAKEPSPRKPRKEGYSRIIE